MRNVSWATNQQYKYVSQIFDQINSASVNIRNVFQKYLKTPTDPILLNGRVHVHNI